MIIINKKQTTLLVLGIIFFVIMTISGIYALTEQGVNGALSTSTIDIEIKTYSKKGESDEIEYADDIVVFPGDTVDFIPKIFNQGTDCYLRMKINYINDSINFEDYVTGFSKKFTKHGDYYYYDDTFNAKDAVKLFDKITIPAEAESLAVNEKLRIEIIAEALQVKNYTPDYNAEDPWKGVEPTQNVRNAYSVDIDDDSKLIIKYENGTENDIGVPSDFLERTRKLLPGDSFVEDIQINNKDKKNTKYYMKIDIAEDDEETRKLLSQIDLLIRSGDEIIYRGKFSGVDKTLLASLDKGGKKNLQFEVSAPIELSNEYTNIVPKFSITFFAEFEAEKIPLNPKTGDDITISFLTFLLSSIGLVIIIILGARERKRQNI